MQKMAPCSSPLVCASRFGEDDAPKLLCASRFDEDDAPKLLCASGFDVQGATFTIVALQVPPASALSVSATMVKVAPVSSKQLAFLMGMLELSSGSWDPAKEERRTS